MTLVVLWRTARGMWPDLVTDWNMAGLRWREWTWTEMVWMLHNRNIRKISETAPTQMRKYLNATRDNEFLTTWDNMKMADKMADKSQ